MRAMAKEERLRGWASGPNQFFEFLRRTFIVDLPQDVEEDDDGLVMIDATDLDRKAPSPIWWWEMEFEKNPDTEGRIQWEHLLSAR